MNIKRSWPTYPLERFAAGPIVCSSLTVLIIIIVVLGGRWIIPLAHWTPESVGKASAEPTTLGVSKGASRAQPAERRSARGAHFENSFESGPQGGLLGVYQLTGHISRISVNCAESNNREVLRLSLESLTRPSTPSLQPQWRIHLPLQVLLGAMAPPPSGRFLLPQEVQTQVEPQPQQQPQEEEQWELPMGLPSPLA